MADRPALSQPLTLAGGLELRNRLVATAHGRASVYDGVPSADDAAYWARLSAGGVGMCIAGGTVVAPASTLRTRMLTEAWRPEALPGLKRRAEAMRSGGAAATLQILHLGRETLGANTSYAPVAPSAVRSPREPTAPHALTEAELDDVVEGFHHAAANAAAAGFDAIELHAAHGYLLAEFLSPAANRRPDASESGRLALLERVADAVRAAAPGLAVGIRLSVGDPDDAGLSLEQLEGLLPSLDLDYVNLTVGMRADYVRDMATTAPPLLDDVHRLRAATELPLMISHGFRDVDVMEAALEAGADLVGMARALIADPDLPRKVLGGRARELRPCVACNEDCRAFDPVLLCTVNPDLAAPGDAQRRAAPLRRGRVAPAPRRVAVVGAGPAGLETALTLQRHGDADVVVFEASDTIGGAARLAGTAPNRSGWLRIVDYYDANLDPSRVELRLGTRAGAADLGAFDAVVVATGAQERLPAAAADSPIAQAASTAIAAGVESLRGASQLVVVDDGFGWWPAVNALELAAAAGVEAVTLVTPGTGFASTIPAESRVGLAKRLRGTVALTLRPLTTLVAAGADHVTVRSSVAARDERVAADAVIVVGERTALGWSAFEEAAGGVLIVGDAVVPRRVAHAIAEGRAAGTALAGRDAPRPV